MAFQLTATDPIGVFGAIAALIFLGFAGNLIFSKFRFNDTLILIAVGVLMGPILGVVDPAALAAIVPVVGPLALILILFDGGLVLRVDDLKGGLGGAALLGIVGFVATMAGIGAVTAFALDVPFVVGLVLGGILGGTSALVVLPSLQHMKCSKQTATTLGLESALTDILVVVVAFTLISVAAAEGGSFSAQGIASPLVIVFLSALGMGAIGGWVWSMSVPVLREKAFGYMLTLGAMFALYVTVEWILSPVASGGGPLAVLAFGVTLGNLLERAAAKPTRGRREDFGTGMKRFQGEVSFLVRTFFFVYLGIIVDLSVFSDLRTWAIAIILFAVMLAARYLGVAVLQRRFKLQGEDWILFLMGPRGLAAAVLAAEPARRGIPDTEVFVGLAFLILVFSNLTATASAYALGSKPGGKSARSTKTSQSARTRRA